MPKPVVNVGTQFPSDTVQAIDRLAEEWTQTRGTGVKRSTAIREIVHARLVELGYLPRKTKTAKAA